MERTAADRRRWPLNQPDTTCSGIDDASPDEEADGVGDVVVPLERDRLAAAAAGGLANTVQRAELADLRRASRLGQAGRRQRYLQMCDSLS